jgi:hypothetical protein
MTTTAIMCNQPDEFVHPTAQKRSPSENTSVSSTYATLHRVGPIAARNPNNLKNCILSHYYVTFATTLPKDKNCGCRQDSKHAYPNQRSFIMMLKSHEHINKAQTCNLLSERGTSDFHTGFRNFLPRLTSFPDVALSTPTSFPAVTEEQQPMGHGLSPSARAARGSSASR